MIELLTTMAFVAPDDRPEMNPEPPEQETHGFNVPLWAGWMLMCLALGAAFALLISPLSAAWWVHLINGAVAMAIIFLLSVLIARMNNPELLTKIKQMLLISFMAGTFCYLGFALASWELMVEDGQYYAKELSFINLRHMFTGQIVTFIGITFWWRTANGDWATPTRKDGTPPSPDSSRPTQRPGRFL